MRLTNFQPAAERIAQRSLSGGVAGGAQAVALTKEYRREIALNAAKNG
jgi:hypothetical protein